MSPRLMHVHCLPPEAQSDGATLHGVQATLDHHVVATVRFWSREHGGLEAHPSGRTALLAFLPLAMRLGANVEVDDEIDALSLMHALEWQKIMAAWHPKKLQSVDILASRVGAWPRRTLGTAGEALMGFSGGVDSCHTLWRHSRIRKTSPVQVRAGLLVHGMDIPLTDVDGFLGATKRAKRILDAHGAELLTVATDLRELEQAFDLDWETHTHGITLAACLSLFESHFDAVLVASTYSVNDMRLPWGSNPVSDSWLGGAVPYLHDGCTDNKRTKVQCVASDAAMTADLRVCWEGDRKDANCGHCFKCLATQACLWLAGVHHPAAFDRLANVQDLASIPVKNAVNQRLLVDLANEADRCGRHDIARALRRAISLASHGRRSWLRRLRPFFP